MLKISKPIRVALRDRPVDAIVHDILEQAKARPSGILVGECLVGAALLVRLGQQVPVEQSDRTGTRVLSDLEHRLCTFKIADTRFVIAPGSFDHPRLSQIIAEYADGVSEWWFLVNPQLLAAWEYNVKHWYPALLDRAVVMSIESFIGQMITFMGGFSDRKTIAHLTELIELYNEHWLRTLGSRALRIVCDA